VGHRRRQRHAEHRLEHHEQRRRRAGDPLQCPGRVSRILAESLEQHRRGLGEIERRLPGGEPRQHRRELQ